MADGDNEILNPTDPELTGNENDDNDEEQEVQSPMAIVEKMLVSQVFEFEPDELISGSEIGFGMYNAVLRTPGTYKRGELLMLSDNQYVKATSEGIANADSLVILADNIEVGEEEYTEVLVYSLGRFKASRVILPYETDNDSHDELIDAVRPFLMRMKIFLD